MTPLYQVAGWNRNYENSRSREVDLCSFVCVPNDSGPVTLAILSAYDGAAILGIFHEILKLCSRQRKPRDGYLTMDGTREGWRLGSDELGHIWKTPPATIRRALAVLSSQRICLIKLVDGINEAIVAAEELPSKLPSEIGISATTAATPAVSLPSGVGSLSGSPSGSTATTEGVNERRNEGKKEVLSLKGENAELILQEVPAAVTTAAELPSTGGSAGGSSSGSIATTKNTDQILHHEAKILFGKLCQEVFGEARRETQWPNDEEHFLNGILPLQRGEFEIVDWFYRLPAEHEIFKVTRRRQSLRSLLENWKSEVQKIRMARSAAGVNGLHEPEFNDGWTPERVAIRSEILPNEGEWPARFDELPVFVRRRFNEVVKERREKNA